VVRRVPRKPRPKKVNVPKGYDSLWEATLHETVLQEWKHHWDILEAKGRFWDYAEYSKYIHIREALPKGYELVFLFQKPFSPMPGAKVRKDKTKRTHAEWAETNNFTWYSEDTLPKEWKSEL